MGRPIGRGAYGYYSSLVWQPGEYISDERMLVLPDGAAEVGAGYRLVIGMYDSGTQARVPVTVDGSAAGDGYEIEHRISIVEEPPS